MNFLKTSIFYTLIYCNSCLAGHSGGTGGDIYSVKIHKTDTIPVLMFTTSPYLEPPTCNGSPATEWAVTLDEFGKSVYSLVLSAQAQGRKVSINGMHSCNDWGDRESIQHITIVD
jgi:hypothetical protein